MKLLHSIIVPIYNDQDVIRPFYERLSAVFKDREDNFELIYVDDSSHDETHQRIREINATDPRVKCIRLSRNFGHQISILAGMDYARGDTFITMDGDLQHPPELLPKLIELYELGYDVVYTARQNTGFFSQLFYRFYNSLSGIKIDSGSADFRLFSAKAGRKFRQMRERHRLNRGLVSWLGFKQVALPYTAENRAAGKTKFNFRKKLRLALDGLLSFSAMPLRLAAYIGFIVASLSLCYGVWVFVAHLFTNEWPRGWATITFALMLFGGLQLFFLGLIGEYISRMYEEVKARPPYIEETVVGLEPLSSPKG